MNYFSIIFAFLLSFSALAQNNTTYDEALAKKFGADEYGMKTYVFCLLKTGSNTTATPQEQKALFEGHMANIMRLAKENKLTVAGPFMKNDKNYRGIFILNCAKIEEAEALVNTDPAVKAKIFEAELTLWYCSAALMNVNSLHQTIAKNKIE
jgi:uncharacterized protein YciI